MMLQRQHNLSSNSSYEGPNTKSSNTLREHNNVVRATRSRPSQLCQKSRNLLIVSFIVLTGLFQWHYSSVVRDNYMIFQDNRGAQYEHHVSAPGEHDLEVPTTAASTTETAKNDSQGIRSFRRVIFLISMGKDAVESGIVERCVTSIRRRGNWLGPVVLLTDAPTERYNSLYINSPSKTDSTNLNELFYVIQPFHQHYNWNTHTKKQDMIYKRFKTFLLDYVEHIPTLDQIELVYYLDIDIVVGAPLMTFFQYTESRYNISCFDGKATNLPRSQSIAGETPTSSRLFLYKGNYPLPVQSGQLILERRHSRHCLERWRSWMDRDPELILDQLALKNLLNETVEEFHGLKQDIMATRDNSNFGSGEKPNRYPCKIVIMEQEPHLHFPTKPTMMEMPKTGQFPTLIHVKNSKTAGQIPWRVQKDFFRSVLQLSPTEDEEGMQFIRDPSSTTNFNSTSSRKKIARPFLFQASKEWSQGQQQKHA